MRVQIRPENPETEDEQGFVELYIAPDGSCFLSIGREEDDGDEVRTLQIYRNELQHFLGVAIASLDLIEEEDEEEEEGVEV